MIPRIYFLKDEEQLVVNSPTNKYTVQGPRIFISPLLHRVLERRLGTTLTADQYCHVEDTLSGQVSMVEGPRFFFLNAHESYLEIQNALPLRIDEYIEVINRSSGKLKIVRGECSYKLKPFEEYIGEKQKAISIDEHRAVIVRDVSSGELRLITEKQSFFPSEVEELEEVRSKILVEIHEVVVLKDKEGKFHIRDGKSGESSFFVPPHWEILVSHWSSGLHKDQRELIIDKFDLRPKFMWYEFDVRTRDNVELILKVTFFWQIKDVEILIKTTDDAPGDVCSHARSKIIQKISRVEFADFLSEFNQLVNEAIFGIEDSFYMDRGITIHSVEVREIACKDQRTQEVLAEIIQETTTRINRIQKQVSVNEVEMKRIEGALLAEEQEMNLLQIRLKRYREESRIEGQKQAEMIAAFFEGLGTDLDMPQKLKLFETLRKKEMMQSMADGNAKVFLTHEDMELRVDVKD